jgi:L-ascorbate metabolism protein UlaG (beta-lactamase superfamily)
MKITKIGHCCLVVEIDKLKVLTDPGMFTTAQDEINDIDIVLITHEHGDHLHVESVRKIVTNNPKVRIITNSGVGKILAANGINFEVVEDGQSATVEGIKFEGFGNTHEEIYEDYGQVQNTGYFVNNYFFYPGDAFCNPGKPVGLLAFPSPGGWANMKQSVKYVLDIKPKACFPVHDGSLSVKTFMHNVFNIYFPKNGIEIHNLTENQSVEV